MLEKILYLFFAFFFSLNLLSSDDSTTVNASIYVYKDISIITPDDIDFGSMSYSRALTHPTASTSLSIKYDNTNGGSISINHVLTTSLSIPPVGKGITVLDGEIGISSSLISDVVDSNDPSLNIKSYSIVVTINTIEEESKHTTSYADFDVEVSYN